MPRVMMFKFAEFCVGDSSARDRIIKKREAGRRRAEKLRQRHKEPGGGDYYSVLRKQFREKHWQTGDIHQLAEATFDLDPCKHGKQLQDYEDLTGKYVDMWRAEDASYFEVPSAQVSLGDLSVTVDWVVGMRTHEAERAFKLWLFKHDFPPNILDVCSYLLWQAAEHAQWPRPWRPGIWDVRSSRLLEVVSPPDGTEEWVHQCAAEFVARSTRAREPNARGPLRA